MPKGKRVVDGLKEAVAFGKTGKGASMSKRMYVLVNARTGAFVCGYTQRRLAAEDRDFREFQSGDSLRIVAATLTWEV